MPRAGQNVRESGNFLRRTVTVVRTCMVCAAVVTRGRA